MEQMVSDIAGSWIVWIVAGMFTAMGTLAVAEACWRILRATERTDGTVVALDEKTDSDGTTYWPVVAFAVAGVEHRVVDSMGSYPASHRVGDGVPVFFPPGAPDKARFGRWRYLWPPLVFAALGWILIAVIIAWRPA